jgi:hypothetical protein
MLVRGSKITWRQSLITRMLILSGPGDLFEGMETIIARNRCARDWPEVELVFCDNYDRYGCKI